MGADRATMLASEKREARSIYPYRRGGGAADSTDERALSSISKENRQDSTKTTHRIVDLWSAITTTFMVSCCERVSGGIPFDWSCVTLDPSLDNRNLRGSTSGSASKKTSSSITVAEGYPNVIWPGPSGSIGWSHVPDYGDGAPILLRSSANAGQHRLPESHVSPCKKRMTT